MIVTLTMSPAVDMFATTEQFYTDSKTRCQIVSRAPGGGGINVARNLKRLGLDVLAIFPAGGHHGDLLESMLVNEALPCLRVPIVCETTQNIALSESASGTALHLVFPGARLEPHEWQACMDAVLKAETQAEMLVISGSLPAPIPEDFVARIINECHVKGIRVVLDTSGAALRAAFKSGVYLVKLNREDFMAMGYTGADTPNDRMKAMQQMVADGFAENMVLTLGPDGALLASQSGEALHARPPSVEVVSHVGAGDSFVSVMTCKLYQGRSVQEAFCYGVAAAAASISTAGNQLEDLGWLEQVYQGVSLTELNQ